MNYNKTIIIILIIILSILGFSYYISQTQTASVLNIQVSIRGDGQSAAVQDITAQLKHINKMAEPKGDLLEVPGVIVNIIQNKDRINVWSTKKYTGTGVYNFTVGLIKYPKPGDKIRIIVEIVDQNNTELENVGKDIILE